MHEKLYLFAADLSIHVIATELEGLMCRNIDVHAYAARNDCQAAARTKLVTGTTGSSNQLPATYTITN
jgi:hypothetical protein